MSRAILPYREKVLLGNLLLAEFTSSGKTFREFATYAEEKLACPVTVGHVTHACKELDLHANFAIGGSPIDQSWKAEVERRLRCVEQRLDVYLSTGKKVGEGV